MTKNNIIQTIKNKEMDRKDFLKYSGLAIAALVGFKTVISMLTSDNNQKIAVIEKKNDSRGFGGGKYGV